VIYVYEMAVPTRACGSEIGNTAKEIGSEISKCRNENSRGVQQATNGRT
jgi:hypothetical protein